METRGRYNEPMTEDYDRASHLRVLKDILSDGNNYHRASPTDRGTALIAWASSIATHFRMEQRSPGCHIQGPAVPEQQIGSSIADFLDIVNDRLRETSKSDFVNPALLALVSVLDALTPSGTMVFSPTLDHVVNTRKWSPDALWLTLASTQELVEKQLFLPNKDWRIQPFWRFTALLGVQSCLTNWTPPYGLVANSMWYVTPFHTLPNPDAAIATMAAKLPGSFSAALEFYRDEDEEIMTPSMVASIFGMDYAQANAPNAVRTLLDIMTDHVLYQSYNAGMQLFQARYPDLYTMFQLQVSLQQHNDSDWGIAGCVDGWNRIIHRQTPASTTLPYLGFESP